MAKMTVRTSVVAVNAKVFKWLRESAGYSIEEITDIIKPKINLKELEERNEDIKLPLSTIKKLAKLYKRQVGCFFFPTVPEDEKEIKLTYYRMVGLEPVELKLGTEEAKKIYLAYRRARYYQSIIEDISEEGEEKKGKVEKEKEERRYSLTDDPEACSNKERERFEKERPDLMKGTHEKVLKNLRDLLADNAIYTLQFDLPLDMIRGFSLTQKPYILVINKNDSPTGKIFTLLHEYAHILLRLNEDIICSNMELLSNNNDNYKRTNNIKDIEIWCNRFAAAFLLPYKHIHNELLRYRKEPYRQLLERLSKNYKASTLAVAYRILNMRPDPIIQDRLLALQDEIRADIENIRIEAIQNIKKVEETYIFTWEDIPPSPVPLKSNYNRLYDFVSKKLSRLDHSIDSASIKVQRDIAREEILFIINGKRIASIKIGDKDKTATLAIEGVEKTYNLDVRRNKKDGKREIHKPMRHNIPNEKRSELGDGLIKLLLDAYSNNIINLDELVEYLGIKVKHVKKLSAIIKDQYE